ncbi:MAG: hypothetical protein FD127_791 [Acidimicrobiaceae bacterium]|nr:MAG: hypothetical protein FD127_791 [Acidimicrobiaceae bacterium]
MGGDDLQGAMLAQEPAVVHAEHDVRDDPQPGLGEQPERPVEVVDREIEVVDVADRLVGADDVEHHRVDPGGRQALGDAWADDSGVDDDLHVQLAADARDRVEVVLHRHPTVAGGPAGNQDAVGSLAFQPAGNRHQLVAGAGRDHALQHLCLAVVALQGTAAPGDRDRHEATAVLGAPLVGLPPLEARSEEVDLVAEVCLAQGEAGHGQFGAGYHAHSAKTPWRR